MIPSFLRSWRFWSTCLLLPAGILGAVIFAQQFVATVNEPVPTQLAPDFQLADGEDRPVALSSFRGEPAVLIFWTSWNEVSLQTAAEAHRTGIPGARVILINSAEDPAEAKEAAQKAGLLSGTVLWDPLGETSSLYETGVLPLTVFIDRQGWVRRRTTGPLPDPLPRAWLREIGLEYN